MARELVTRSSDGKTVDLELQAAEQADLTARAKKTTIVDSTGTAISNANPLPTTATISGDVNVDITSISVQAYIGKPAGTNADFVTTRTGTSTFTCSTLPTTINLIKNEDIELIRQINTSGEVVESYTRDDAIITCSGTDPTTVTVTGASFGASDSIILYTNLYKPIEADVQIGAVEIKNATTDDRVTIIKPGATGALITEDLPLSIRIDNYTTSNVTYIGKAETGSTEGSAVWQIKKFDTTTGVSVTWADGNTNFDKVWTNRASLTYS